MPIKKKNNRKRRRKKEDELLLDDNLAAEVRDSEAVAEEVEDDDEFISQVKQFEKQHKNSTIVNIYELAGKPKIFLNINPGNNRLKKEFDKLISILDGNGIIIHFHNEYSIEEKYRFLVEEVFKQDVEKDGRKNHVTFIYEDFHPEIMDDGEEEL